MGIGEAYYMDKALGGTKGTGTVLATSGKPGPCPVAVDCLEAKDAADAYDRAAQRSADIQLARIEQDAQKANGTAYQQERQKQALRVQGIADAGRYDHDWELKGGVTAQEIPVEDGWIQTYTGRQFWPVQPRVQDVFLEDIAHALSLKARYEGHTRRHYSVALHCIRCAGVAPQGLKLATLLHDASETYMPDVARPTKVQWGAVVRDTESRLHTAIYEAFGLGYLLPLDPHIKTIDNRMLVTERRDLMHKCTLTWGDWAEKYPAYEHTLRYLPMMETKGTFIRQFYLQYHLELSNQRSPFWTWNSRDRANDLFEQFNQAVVNCGAVDEANIFAYHNPQEQWDTSSTVE